MATLAMTSLHCAAPASAATPRDGFTETSIASGLSHPTTMAFAPDGRLFVAEQAGTLRVIKDGALLPDPFLTLTVSAYGERGLLGLAFDPEFSSNHFLYVYYTATEPTAHNRVSRFTAQGDMAEDGSEVVLLDLPPLDATTHNGGSIHFGLDGLLYIAVGENGVAWNAQSLDTPLGKMLRIRSDGTIPTDNPFFGQTTGVNGAIWAWGLRNPFTFAFEPSSGRMLINDVGEDDWEEIDEGIAGANYGWPENQGPTDEPGFVSPLYAYTHASGCAITGGAFYPILPSEFPSDYAGDYFFADFCGGWIHRYDFTTGIDTVPFVSGILAPVDLVVGPEGGLYYLARGFGENTGKVVRVDYAPPEPPAISNAPPVPLISAPGPDSLYIAGGTVSYAGSATDPEDGTLPPSRFTWEIVLHHDADTLTVVGPVSGSASGSFVVPTTGETSPDAWYRIQLTVTDSGGQQASTFVDIHPRTVSLTLRANPSGPWLTLDGQPVVAPLTFRSVIGMSRMIGAVSPQTMRNMKYDFRSWSDRGTQTHAIITPVRSATFTATFRAHRVAPSTSEEPVRYAVPRP